MKVPKQASLSRFQSCHTPDPHTSLGGTKIRVQKEDPEAQRGEVSSPRSHSQWTAGRMWYRSSGTPGSVLSPLATGGKMTGQAGNVRFPDKDQAPGKMQNNSAQPDRIALLLLLKLGLGWCPWPGLSCGSSPSPLAATRGRFEPPRPLTWEDGA